MYLNYWWEQSACHYQATCTKYQTDRHKTCRKGKLEVARPRWALRGLSRMFTNEV
jgi:hypothetical protein